MLSSHRKETKVCPTFLVAEFDHEITCLFVLFFCVCVSVYSMDPSRENLEAVLQAGRASYQLLSGALSQKCLSSQAKNDTAPLHRI